MFVATGLGLGAVTAGASTFDVSISPPRIEKRSAPGKIVRDVIRITNLDRSTGSYLVRTADWELTAEGGVRFNEGAPDAGSCRPWVRIERHVVSVPAGASKSYRYEIHVPADAPAGECRFALLVSPDPKSIKPVELGQIRFPVVGRIGVIAYLTLGEAKPRLEFEGLQLREERGKRFPVAILRNVGNAHGRPFGSLTATGPDGRKVELLVEQSPILPGQQRAIRLRPVDWSGGEATDVSLDLGKPMRIRGRIDWDGGSVKLDETMR